MPVSSSRPPDKVSASVKRSAHSSLAYTFEASSERSRVVSCASECWKVASSSMAISQRDVCNVRPADVVVRSSSANLGAAAERQRGLG